MNGQVERGSQKELLLSLPPLHAALRSNAELERGAGGVRSAAGGRSARRGLDKLNDDGVSDGRSALSSVAFRRQRQDVGTFAPASIARTCPRSARPCGLLMSDLHVAAAARYEPFCSGGAEFAFQRGAVRLRVLPGE